MKRINFIKNLHINYVSKIDVFVYQKMQISLPLTHSPSMKNGSSRSFFISRLPSRQFSLILFCDKVLSTFKGLKKESKEEDKANALVLLHNNTKSFEG